MFSVTNTYNVSTMSVDNQFLRWLCNYMYSSYSNLQTPMFVLRTNKNKEQYHDINGLPAINDTTKPNLYTEITDLRYQQHGGTGVLDDKQRDVLLVDYLLKTCICYVEIFKGSIPTKFYATRNVELLKFLVDNGVFEVNKDLSDATVFKRLSNLCRPLSIAEITEGSIKYIKLEQKKRNFSVVEPRNTTYMQNSNMRITPVFFNQALSSFVFDKLRENIMRISYIKDNLVKRTIISTLNVDYLTKVYEGDRNRAVDVINRSASYLTRGFISIPELLLPLSDESGCRAMSFRIVGMEIIDPNTFTNPYLHINLDGVQAQFEHYLEMYKNNKPFVEMIAYLVEESCGKFSNNRGTPEEKQNYRTMLSNMTVDQITSNISLFLSTSVLIDKTQTARALHTMMISNPMLFARYTGKRYETTGIDWTAGI